VSSPEKNPLRGEVISIEQVNQAWDRVIARVIARDVRYRFVIDMSTL